MSEKLLSGTQEVDAMFYSRPLNLPGSAFGALSIFFDPVELDSAQVEKLGKFLATCIDQFFRCESKEACSSCSITPNTNTGKRILN